MRSMTDAVGGVPSIADPVPGLNMRRTLFRLVTTLAVVGTATDARAQLNASEPASVSQVVDGSKITVEYSRPRARGRTGLFGTEVKFGEVWTPGANQATTLAVSKDAMINGHPVAKGKYSVWMVVQPGQWELVLDRDTTLFHTQKPKVRPGQVRFAVPREHHAFTETLTWSFPTVRTSGMTLVMQWDTVSVPLEIKVTPSFTTMVSAEAGQRVAGTYHWLWAPAFAKPRVGDTTLTSDPPMKDPKATFTVRYVGGELHATIDPPAFDDPSYGEYVLVQKKGDLYSFGRVDRGELIEVWDFNALQFTVANGRPDSFEVRGTDDALWASGKAAR
jgi:Protein of unknown function (DUF2911)